MQRNRDHIRGRQYYSGGSKAKGDMWAVVALAVLNALDSWIDYLFSEFMKTKPVEILIGKA